MPPHQSHYMVPQHTADAISSCASKVRLSRYAAAAQEDGVPEVATYLWNCALSEAFFLPLHFAEVTCRNAIHSALCFRDPSWPYNKTFLNLLDPTHRAALDRAITDEKEQHGAAMTPDHIVSALSFGFWEHMTTKRFERFLWPRGFQKNFRHAPWQAKLEDLHQQIETVRRWRNRIAHHNAIFDKGPNAKMDATMELIRWSSPAAASWLSGSCRLNAVINARPKT